MKKVFLCLILSLLLLVPSFAESTEFTDLSEGHWAFGAVENLREMQILSGYEDGLFKPDALITREEFAVMVSKGFHLKMYENELPTFSDVSPNKWSYEYVEKAKDYLTGYYPYGGAPYFQPELYTTREDVAVTLVRALNLPMSQMNLESQFIDSDDISTQLKDYIATAVDAGLIVGYSTGEFKPQSPITRAEVAVLINKALKQSNFKQDFMLSVEMPSDKISPYLVINGTTHKDAVVTINGRKITTYSGDFSVLNELTDGEKVYAFEITAEMPDGRHKSYYQEVNYSIPADFFDVNVLQSTTEDTVMASGFIEIYENDFIVSIDNQRLYIGNDGYWEKELELKQGENTFVFTMIDYLGRRHEVIKTVTFKPDASLLTVHVVPEQSKDRTFVLSGYVDKYHDSALLTINHLLVGIGCNGLFRKEITLMPGDNLVTVSYTNEYNMLTTKEYHILYEALESTIELVEPPVISHDQNFMINFQVVGEKDTHVNTYLNNKLMSEKRTIRNGFEESLVYQVELDYKEGLNEFIITNNQSNGQSVNHTFAVEFVPLEPEVNLLSIGNEGDGNYLRLSVTDSYNSVLSAYYGTEQVNATSVQKYADTKYVHYYKIELSDELLEFSVINHYGKKATYTINQ